jgi:hypothetical protein
MASESFPTWISTGPSSICSKPVTKQSDLVTASLTSIFSVSSCSFSFCICALSSANLAWMSSFSCCTTQNCSMASSFSLFKAFVAYSFSSSTRRRIASVTYAILHSWAGSSPKYVPSDDGGAVDTAWLE